MRAIPRAAVAVSGCTIGEAPSPRCVDLEVQARVVRWTQRRVVLRERGSDQRDGSAGAHGSHWHNPLSNDLPAGQRTGVIGLVLLDEFERRSAGAVAGAARNFASTRERSELAAERFIALIRNHDFLGFVRALGG